MRRAPTSAAAGGIAILAMALLGACAGGPPAPDWQASARSSLDLGVAAYLSGDAKAEAEDFERARGSIARTGRADLLARAELMRCAAQVASLVFEPCERVDRLRADVPEAEQAYADFLAGRRLMPAAIQRLPAAQQSTAAAVAGGEASLANAQSIEDPLSRLIGIAVLFQAGKASPAHIALAVETASAQGWRRPLLGWLKVQAQLAERAGHTAEVQRLQRRIDLVAGGSGP